MSFANGQIRVRHGFSYVPSLTERMPQVILSNRSASTSELTASGSLVSFSMLFMQSGRTVPSTSEGDKLTSGGTNQGSVPVSSSPVSNAEKLKVSDLEGLEPHSILKVFPSPSPSPSVEEGKRSESHGVGPGSSNSPNAEESGVCSPSVSTFGFGWPVCFPRPRLGPGSLCVTRSPAEDDPSLAVEEDSPWRPSGTDGRRSGPAVVVALTVGTLVLRCFLWRVTGGGAADCGGGGGGGLTGLTGFVNQ